jgi:hypothetical protein
MADWLGGEHMILSFADPMPFVHRVLRETRAMLRRLGSR